VTDRRLRPVAVDGYRAELADRAEETRARIQEVCRRYDEVSEAHAAKIDQLADPPMADEETTEVDYSALPCRPGATASGDSGTGRRVG
jgi:hypothetical protein